MAYITINRTGTGRLSGAATSNPKREQAPIPARSGIPTEAHQRTAVPLVMSVEVV